MTVYDSYTILNPTPGKYEADHPLVIGVNQSRVKTTINVPEIFAAGRYYFRGVNTVISGVVASDAGKPAYIEANLQDGEIGAGTLMLLSVHGVEANFPYSIKHVPLFETEIDTSGLVTKDTFNSTVARIDADIQKGDTANRTAIDQLTAATNQRFADVNAKLSGYDEQIGAVDTEVKNLASEVDGYSTDIAKAVADAADAKSVAEGAADDAATASAEAGEAKDAVSNLGVRVTQVETDVETAETVANQAKSTADAAAQTAGNAQSAADEAKQDIAGLEMRFDDLQTFYVKSRQTRTGNVKPGGDPYNIPASVLSLLINIVGSSYSVGETITFEFYANTTDESPVTQIPCRVLSTGISNLDVLVDFAAGTFSIYETDISQTPAKQLTKKLANGFNVMRTHPGGYKKINVKTSATHEKPNTMFMIVRSLF